MRKLSSKKGGESQFNYKMRGRRGNKETVKRGPFRENERNKRRCFYPNNCSHSKEKSFSKKALDARALNQEIEKDEYQMSNLGKLLFMGAEKLNSKNGEAWYSKLDMTYAYGQVPLHHITAKHCNFQISGGEFTGTYRFVTSFHGLTIMPTKFQKVMDILLGRF